MNKIQKMVNILFKNVDFSIKKIEHKNMTIDKQIT